MGIYRRAFHHIGYELDVLHEYVLTVHSGLRDAHERLQQRVTSSAKGLPSDEAQEIFNDYAEDDAHYGEVFPALSNYSSLIVIMSFLEHELVEICRQVQKAKKIPPIGKMQNPVLKNCRDLLATLGIIIPETPEWFQILEMQETRNAIVHQLGELDRTELAIQGTRPFQVNEFLKGRSDASVISQYVDGPHKILLTHDFCLEAIEVIRKFLDQVVGLIPMELYSKAERER